MTFLMLSHVSQVWAYPDNIPYSERSNFGQCSRMEGPAVATAFILNSDVSTVCYTMNSTDFSYILKSYAKVLSAIQEIYTNNIQNCFNMWNIYLSLPLPSLDSNHHDPLAFDAEPQQTSLPSPCHLHWRWDDEGSKLPCIFQLVALYQEHLFRSLTNWQ